MSRLSIVVLASILAVGAGGADAGADPERMAWQWMDMMALSGDAEAMNGVAVDMQLVADAFPGDPLLRERLAPGLEQAMNLVRGCDVPASCGLASDLARAILTAAVARGGGDPARAASVGYWNRHDRFSRILAPGYGLAYSDLLGAEKLVRLAEDSGIAEPGASATVSDDLLRRWDAGDDLYRAFLTRLSAWSDGAIAAWPELSEDERRDAIAFLTDGAVPSRDVFPKVTGAIDKITWIAAAEMPLSEQEIGNSLDLLALVDAGVFAGPMRPAVSGEMIFLTAQPGVGPAYARWRAGFVAGAAADALFHDWDALANMTPSR